MTAKKRISTAVVVFVFVATLLAARGLAQAGQSETKGKPSQMGDWPAYGGAPENNHYSILTQINRTNVKQLAVAWRFDTGEEGGLQTSPIIVNGVLYGITPKQKVFALDATTGKLKWKFDSGIKGTQPDRGLSYWTDGKGSRILVGVTNFLYALDAATGKPIATFGKQGPLIFVRIWGGYPRPRSPFT